MSMEYVYGMSYIPPREYVADLRTRELVWSWYYMIYDGAIFPANLDLEGNAILDVMAEFLVSKTDFGYQPEAENGIRNFQWREVSRLNGRFEEIGYLAKMETDKREMLVDDSAFDWVGKDLRQLYWFHDQVIKSWSGWQTLPQNQLRLPIRDFTIAIVDAAKVHKASAIEFLANLKKQWAVIQSKNNLTDWIKPTERGLSKWAFEYLEKKGITCDQIQGGAIEDEHLRIMILLDIAFPDMAQKELFIAKMNRAWRHKKYRLKNKDKKQFNFWLEKESGARLEYAARFAGYPKNELLDALIDKEYRRILARKRLKNS